ncbi:multicopper oxidase domain-containing protein [Pseudarthrobacter sulfonivorans]|uniref:multicopper oxidase domain-containing protein n=1 Tax=Pseudarthrobacter sulfonivorans TaxID=121292 RepID=UPI00285D0E45|nr:multicopper oxidase domain-containing protein [Pseudarthrobacter sulfonivorans]MDR6417222.1 FtsP/CotA-like multicopper oxidase with cupredoxin domain [Pseudarthrobacter sulfonivorans]
MSPLELHINDGYLPMVDGSRIYHRGFGDRWTMVNDPKPSLTVYPRVFLRDGRIEASRTYPLNAAVPPFGRPEPAAKDDANPGEFLVRQKYWASFFPDRTLIAETGSTISIRVTNHLAQDHELQFLNAGADYGHVSSGAIKPGQTGYVEFPAPAAGTYLYCDPGAYPADPTVDPVQRVLGLYGALLVIDPESPWVPMPDGPEFERQWLWMLHNVDPVWAGIASRNGTVDPDKTPVLPRYFTLNGRSGFQSLAASTDEELNRMREEDTLMSGSARQVDVRDFSLSAAKGTVRTGQLMRFLNAGVVHHQLHFHGNHLWTVNRNGKMFPRNGGRVDADGHVVLQQWEDVVEMHPLDRKDSMLPLRRPPEVIDEVWNARKEDWHYPMHCHAEPSQVARGGMYPGGLVGHWTVAAPGEANEAEHELYRSQVDFSSHQMHEGRPETEFRKKPDVALEFKFLNREMKFDDGGEFEMWTFETERSGRIFPAPLIRITEGQVFHGTVRPSKKVHTIHWHGIEPDPRNDGVGHTSFEVSGSYTYQWRPERGEPGDPNRGASGTYFYHCHVNTPLHVQMGMFGPLIIDPASDPRYPVAKGARRAFVDGPEYDIDTESILVPYSVDPRWHELNHAAGLSGEDAGLDKFKPRHFYLLGGELARVPKREGPIFLTRLRARMAGGEVKPTLLRLLNANYFPVNARFTDSKGMPVAMAELISHDGRPFRDTSSPTGPARPISHTGPLKSDLINFGAAERYDMLLRPPAAGTYWLTVDLLDWITEKVLFTRKIPVVAA